MSAEDRQRWDDRYQHTEDAPTEPSLLLTQLDDMLPRQGTALDLAGGAGRHAIWLAQRGLDVTLADISPVGLDLARRRGKEAGVEVKTECIDFEHEPIPRGPWDLIVSFFFLQRSLFTEFSQALRPGGLLVFVQPTRSNLERHSRPPERFLLDDGELPRLLDGLEVIHYEEGWLAEERHDAFLVARAPVGPIFLPAD